MKIKVPRFTHKNNDACSSDQIVNSITINNCCCSKPQCCVTIAAIAGGTIKGQVGIDGVVIDDDETQNNGIRREGILFASNADHTCPLL